MCKMPDQYSAKNKGPLSCFDRMIINGYISMFFKPQSQILWDGTLRTYFFLLASNSLRKKYSSSGSP